jgi:hypothetical protein
LNIFSQAKAYAEKNGVGCTPEFDADVALFAVLFIMQILVPPAFSALPRALIHSL